MTMESNGITGTNTSASAASTLCSSRSELTASHVRSIRARRGPSSNIVRLATSGISKSLARLANIVNQQCNVANSQFVRGSPAHYQPYLQQDSSLTILERKLPIWRGGRLGKNEP